MAVEGVWVYIKAHLSYEVDHGGGKRTMALQLAVVRQAVQEPLPSLKPKKPKRCLEHGNRAMVARTFLVSAA